jgi:hypothetical protein
MAQSMGITESAICQNIYGAYVRLGVRNKKDACAVLCGAELEEKRKRITKPITEDEKRVLALMAQGYTVREIQKMLEKGINARNCLKRIRAKLNIAKVGEDQRVKLLRRVRNEDMILPEEKVIPIPPIITPEKIRTCLAQVEKIEGGMDVLKILATETFFISYLEIGEILGMGESTVGEKTLAILKIFGYEEKEKRREGRLFLKSLLQNSFLRELTQKEIEERNKREKDIKKMLTKIRGSRITFEDLGSFVWFFDIREEELLVLLKQAKEEGRINQLPCARERRV